MNCSIKSNIKIKSNIITKDKWERSNNQYLPFDLLSFEYRDPDLWLHLTGKQQKRYIEILYHCKKKRENTSRIWETSKSYENCNNCELKEICR